MSQNNHIILYAGLDVAKSSLQLHLDGRSHLLANDPKGHAQLLKLLRPYPQAQIVCEATGGYEQPVVRALHAAAVAVSIVEAGRAAGRGALYMATLCAVKHDRILKAFYQRCGTPAKNLGGPDRLHAQTHRPHEPPPQK
jgi:transposase